MFGLEFWYGGRVIVFAEVAFPSWHGSAVDSASGGGAGFVDSLAKAKNVDAAASEHHFFSEARLTSPSSGLAKPRGGRGAGCVCL
jgi:hypothetical protein